MFLEEHNKITPTFLWNNNNKVVWKNLRTEGGMVGERLSLPGNKTEQQKIKPSSRKKKSDLFH